MQMSCSRTPSTYPVEQKQRAVQHYLDHDQCVASTLRALGYPCRDLFTRWIDELHPQLRRRMVGRAPNTQHSPEVKNAAVLELCTRTTNALTIAESVGVCRPTLYNWKNQILVREGSASMKRRQTSQTAPEPKDLTELEQQVVLLERDVRRLQLGHDLLKKVNELLKKPASPCSSYSFIAHVSGVLKSARMPALPLPMCSKAISVEMGTNECVPRICRVVTYVSRRKSYSADEAGMLGGCCQQKTSVRVIPGRNQPCAGEPDLSGLPSRLPQ